MSIAGMNNWLNSKESVALLQFPLSVNSERLTVLPLQIIEPTSSGKCENPSAMDGLDFHYEFFAAGALFFVDEPICSSVDAETRLLGLNEQFPFKFKNQNIRV